MFEALGYSITDVINRLTSLATISISLYRAEQEVSEDEDDNGDWKAGDETREIDCLRQ